MKKSMMAIILAAVMLLMLAACGGTAPKNSNAASESTSAESVSESKSEYPGTWLCVAAEINGSRFTVDELASLGMPQAKDLVVVIKDGGMLYMGTSEGGDMGQWTETANGITANGEECPYEDGYLKVFFDDEGNCFYFEKTSDSQEIPSTTPETDLSVEEQTAETEESSEEANAKDDAIRPEFKEAMDSYEAFFDEYIEFMKKFEDNSSDLSMLLEYSQFMSQYTETMSALDEIDEDDLSDAEFAYYTETMMRINQKMYSALD